MELTRVNTAELKAAVEKAGKKMQEALDLMEPYFVALTVADRAAMARTRDAFPDGARKLVRAAAKRKALADSVNFDGEAVTEDLDNAALLAPLEEKVSLVQQRVADSRLTWLAEAQQPSLVLYGVAQVAARKDGELQELVDSLADVFMVRKGKKKVPPPAK